MHEKWEDAYLARKNPKIYVIATELTVGYCYPLLSIVYCHKTAPLHTVNCFVFDLEIINVTWK